MSNTLYEPRNRAIKDLISEIRTNKLGIPILQRGYVWKATQVRDLLDSMIKGYPIGSIIVWESPNADQNRQVDRAATGAISSVIIDGQQRLTSLYAILEGVKVAGKTIIISFNPVSAKFEVATPALQKSADWVYDISEALKEGEFDFINNWLVKARERRGGICADTDLAIQVNLKNLFALSSQTVPLIMIKGDADEETVADIFVRVNSKGTSLKQSDFILTLMSTYWKEGREKIELFCESVQDPSKREHNLYFHPEPNDIVRAVMSYGFRRAKLQYAYLLLRGRDFDKREYSEELRVERLEKLKVFLDNALNVQTLKDFAKCIPQSGVLVRGELAQGLLTNAYALYLIGKHDFKVEDRELNKLIAAWIFFASTVGYYSGSVETIMEADLAEIGEKGEGKIFTDYFRKRMADRFTNDYFTVTLPNELVSESTQARAWKAFCAAQNILNPKAMFSERHVRDLGDPSTRGTKKSLEYHHLFPKDYLKGIGIVIKKDYNQLANFALLEYKTNIKISNQPPSFYYEAWTNDMSSEARDDMLESHALPYGWQNLDYFDFLKKRRELMARMIKKAYEKIVRP